jgi:hypothetical protein
MNFKHLIWIIVAGLIFPSICFGQNSWNMELIGKAAYDGQLYDYTAYGNYLYVITNKPNPYRNLLTVIDNSNPAHPHRVRSMNEGEISSGMLVLDSLLYVRAMHEGDTVIIYSLQNPSWPQELARINLGAPAWRFDRLNENLIGSPSSYNTYCLFDFHDRLNPQVIATIDLQYGETSAKLKGNYLYVAEQSGLIRIFLEVFDISDTLNPSSVYFSEMGFGANSQITVIGEYLYYYMNYGAGIRVLSIIDPSNPVLVDTVLSDYSISEIEVSGENALMVGRFDSLLTINVTDPTNPIIVNAYYNQGDSRRLQLIGERLYFSSAGNVISTFNNSNPLSPLLEGRYLPGSIGWDIAKFGNYAYTVSGNGGFRIFDISDPTDPVGVEYYETDEQTFKIHINNGILYLADHYAGVLIFSLTDPLNPQLLSNIDLESGVHDMHASDGILYIAYSYGFVIADVTYPSNPNIIGQYFHGYYANDYRTIIAYENYAYTAETDSGFCVYDVSNPVEPVRIECFGSGVSRDIYIQDTVLYIADYQNGLSIFNISNPSSPIHISTTPPNGPMSVYVYNDIAYLAYMHYEDGVKIYDISNLNNPVLIGTYEDYGFSNGVVVENDTAYISAGNGGMWILRYDSPTGIYQNGEKMPRISMLDNYPNPFNASTTIEYGLPTAGRVRIDIYDLLGRRIEMLVDEEVQGGRHQVVWDASDYSSGVYFYRIKAGDYTEAKKMILLK